MLERYVPPLLWVVFIGQAFYGGLTIPHAELPLKGSWPQSMLLGFFVFGVISAVVMQRNVSRISSADDTPLARTTGRLRFPLLAATFFTLMGAIALLRSVNAGSPPANVFFSEMTLIAGLGMFLGLGVEHGRNRSRSA